MDGVAGMLTEIRVEASFPDGARLLCLSDPIRA
jgi:urease gamma subunit